MPLSKAYREREQDILDKYALKQITRNEFIKLMAELCGDYHEAQSSLRLADECNSTGEANESLGSVSKQVP